MAICSFVTADMGRGNGSYLITVCEGIIFAFSRCVRPRSVRTFTAWTLRVILCTDCSVEKYLLMFGIEYITNLWMINR